MKKIISMVLCLVLMLSMSGCGNKEEVKLQAEDIQDIIESQPSTAPEQSDISEKIPGAGTIVFSTELETALESKIENIEVILYFRDFSDDEYREKHLESLMYEGKTISDWKNIWQNSLEEKDEKKYVEAYEFAANSDEFIDWLKNYEIEFQNKAIAEELERLKAVGYNFQTQKDASGFTGILSKQQIIDFPCVDYVGYYLDAN